MPYYFSYNIFANYRLFNNFIWDLLFYMGAYIYVAFKNNSMYLGSDQSVRLYN